MSTVVTITVPTARGRRGFIRDRRTFAVLVTDIDRSRQGVAAIQGERVRGTIAARPEMLLLVYGEDRAPNGNLLAHCVDVYRVSSHGLGRVALLTLVRPWLAEALDALEHELLPQHHARRRRTPRETVPLMLPPGAAAARARSRR